MSEPDPPAVVASPLRVVLADADSLSRRGMRRVLTGSGFAVCAEAEEASAAIGAVLEHQPDLAVVSTGLPGGLDVAAEVAHQSPRTRLIALTREPGAHELLCALRSGFAGYLPEDMDLARLPHTLQAVAAGETAVPRLLVGHIVEEMRQRGPRRQPFGLPEDIHLSDREGEVFELLGEGASTAAMAERLQISPITVRRHVSALLHKLGAPDREAAVRLVRRRSP